METYLLSSSACKALLFSIVAPLSCCNHYQNKYAYLVEWNVSKAYCRIISRLKNPFPASIIQVKAPLKQNWRFLAPNESFHFLSDLAALTKSIVCVSGFWLNNETNPARSIPHGTYRQTKGCLLLKATFRKCKSLFLLWSLPVEKKPHCSVTFSRD